MTVIDMSTKRREKSVKEMEIRHTQTTFGNEGTEHDTTINDHYTKNLGVLESPDFFEPLEAPLFANYNGESVEVPNRKAIIRSDTGEVISTVGSKYKIVNNKEIFNKLDRSIIDSGIDTTGAYKRVSIAANGARTFCGYSFPAYEETITNRDVGDVVRLTLLAINSYDASSPFITDFREERLACKNSMVSGLTVASFRGRHTQNLQVEHAAEKIRRSIDVFCNKADLYKRWANENISLDFAIKCFSKLCVKRGHTTEVNEKTMNEYCDQFNLETQVLGHTKWALYNTLTHISTHKEVQDRTIKAGNAPMRQFSREAELTKFLKGAGREFLDFGVAA